MQGLIRLWIQLSRSFTKTAHHFEGLYNVLFRISALSQLAKTEYKWAGQILYLIPCHMY